MKTKLGILIFLLAAALARAQTNNLTALLQQGLFEEQANRNLDAAIADYQALARQFDKDRQLAATAVFRLGECYRMQGKTNEAALEYQRILRDFSDQAPLATLSQQDLTGMGMTPVPAASAALQTQKDLLAKQIALAEQDLTDTQRLVQTGVVPQDKVRTAEREVLRLKQQLATLGSGRAELPDLSIPVKSAEDQEIERIQTMIQNSPDLINAPEPMNALGTPLVKVAYNGWLKAAAFLLDHGADVNGVAVDVAQTSELRFAGKVTPLLAAIAAGNRTMTDFLVSRGANVEFQTPNGDRPLHLAARLGFQAVVESLLAHHANVNALNNVGETPLFYAVRGGQLPIVKALLAAGANVNLANNDGWTALNRAIRTSPEMIQPLLDAGANPNTEDAIGRTPLSYAVESVSPQGNRQSRLGGRGGRGPATAPGGLNMASLNSPGVKGSPEVVKLLLAAKADPNGGTKDEPLLCAIINGSIESAELLLAAGAKPNAVSDLDLSPSRTTADFLNHQRHLTPLWLAVYLNQSDMVQLLLQYKADPDDSQTNGQPLLFRALSDTNILEALVGAGAKVDAMGIGASPNNVNLTPLGEAAWQQNAAAMEILLKHGASPNGHFPDRNWTALHCAAIVLADRKVFELLLAYKADRNVRDINGQSPLDILKQKAKPDDLTTNSAGKKKAVELADLLRQHGALDVLPDWDRITVSRPSAKYSTVIFYKGTNDWNQFTLFDLLGVQYELLTASPSGERRIQALPYGAERMVEPNPLSYPDFTRILIHRPTATGTNWQDLKINLARALDSSDCAGDVRLQFGDTVEIPESDHVINDQWRGLSTNALFTLKNCLARRLQITVNGQTTSLIVAPDVRLASTQFSANAVFSDGGHYGPVGLFRFEPFMLWPVLEHSKLLLASSDLSRITVKRPYGATGKTREWTVDCSNPSSPPNFWLRDGDVIDVPAK